MLILIRYFGKFPICLKSNLMKRLNGLLYINKKESIEIKNSMTNSIIKLL